MNNIYDCFYYHKEKINKEIVDLLLNDLKPKQIDIINNYFNDNQFISSFNNLIHGLITKLRKLDPNFMDLDIKTLKRKYLLRYHFHCDQNIDILDHYLTTIYPYFIKENIMLDPKITDILIDGLDQNDLDIIIKYLGPDFKKQIVFNQAYYKDFRRIILKMKYQVESVDKNWHKLDQEILKKKYLTKNRSNITIYDFFKYNNKLLSKEIVDMLLEDATDNFKDSLVKTLGDNYKTECVLHESSHYIHPNLISSLKRKLKKLSNNYYELDSDELKRLYLKEYRQETMCENIYDFFKTDDNEIVPKEIIDIVLDNVSDKRKKYLILGLGNDYKNKLDINKAYVKTAKNIIKNLIKEMESINKHYYLMDPFDFKKQYERVYKQSSAEKTESDKKTIYDYFVSKDKKRVDRKIVDLLLTDAPKAAIEKIVVYLGDDYKNKIIFNRTKSTRAAFERVISVLKLKLRNISKDFYDLDQDELFLLYKKKYKKGIYEYFDFDRDLIDLIICLLPDKVKQNINKYYYKDETGQYFLNDEYQMGQGFDRVINLINKRLKKYNINSSNVEETKKLLLEELEHKKFLELKRKVINVEHISLTKENQKLKVVKVEPLNLDFKETINVDDQFYSIAKSSNITIALCYYLSKKYDISLVAKALNIFEDEVVYCSNYVNNLFEKDKTIILKRN